MCLILLAIDQHPRYPFICAANRDEFHARPTESMHWWQKPPVLAGRDLSSGGTWLAVTKSGQMAAVTNFRTPDRETGNRSRGELPLAMLQAADPSQAMERIHSHHRDYGRFNLFTWDGHEGRYSGSEDNVPWRRLLRGYHGLSNHLLQSPWPKLVQSRRALRQLLEDPALSSQSTDRLHEALIRLLRDETRPPDHELPDTGVGLEMERFLAAPFINGREYGTRASTVLSRDRNGLWQVSEQSYGPEGGALERRRFCWEEETRES